MNRVEEVYQCCFELRKNGELQKARIILEEELKRVGENPDLLTLLGQICHQNGDYKEAVAFLERSLYINRDQLDAIFTLGAAYFLMGEYKVALKLFDDLLEIIPNFHQVHHFRGQILNKLGRTPESKNAFEVALSLDPENPEIMGSLAEILFRNYHFDTAEKLLIHALSINPELHHIRNSLARLRQLQGGSDEAFKMFSDIFKNVPTQRMALSNKLYSLCYLDSITPEESYEIHHSSCKEFFPKTQIKNFHAKKSADNDGRLLNIGYISNDFCLHSVSFFIEPILTHHNREQFAIYCYSNRSTSDETTNRICGLNLHWREISNLSSEDAAKLIQDDKIDILIELSGHTGGNRLDISALKPSPIQCSWIGYPHSTGMEQIDYYISDNHCDPVGMTEHLYCEKIWRLPTVFCAYLPPTEFPAITLPPLISNGYVTFCSFNNLAKVTKTTIKLWSGVLKSIPTSKILIKSASLGGITARRRIIEEFAEHGIDKDRLILKVHTETPLEHLKLYSEADIALDTYPYHGTTTTCEALWMGVPVITLAGLSHVSRVGVSLLKTIGSPELIAESAEDFFEIAAKLASDHQRIIHYRESLRTLMATSPLMNAQLITAELENSYQAMFIDYLGKKGFE